MATPSVSVAGASDMDTGQESTSVEEPTAVDEQASDTSEEAVKVRKPKKAISKKKKQLPEKSEKPEKHRRSLHLLQRQRMKEKELRAARLFRRRCRNSFSIYFPKVLRLVHVGLTLSQRSVSILDSFVKDMFERIVTEASNLARLNNSTTINSREIQSAVRLLLPGEMCDRAIAEGTMAMLRYISTK
ncbi:late histone H2B.L4-like [Microtus oregoni]|uniref:late histone H2B.L4-like n=1 Tax=Microtus oregoni TaxID=111838 RepID=UPI001BB28B26|nr:late histone H2B.L4-like [Microtus oregoni]